MHNNPNDSSLRTRRPPQPTGTIDILHILTGMRRLFFQSWFLMMLLFVLVSGAYIGYKIYLFTPQYEAYVTYAVSVGEGNDASDVTLAGRISSSFPYLIRSDQLYEKFYEELGLAEDEILPVTFKSSQVEETNFVTIKAVSENAAFANQAVMFVNKEFVPLVNIITSNIEYTIVEQSGILDTQINEFSLEKTIALGLAGGLIVVLGVLFLLAYLSDSVRSYEDIRNKLSLSYLGGIPKMKVKRRNKKNASLMTVANGRISREFRESIYQIRSRVEKEMKENDLKVLLVSSSVPGEGKTTISANLALAMAERGEKVLLIDGDLRNPSVADTMGQKELEHGITEVLDGKVSLEEGIVHTAEKLPDLLLGKEIKRETGRYLASKAMKHVIQKACGKYDYVIIDTPPSAMITDASILAGFADAIVYVVRQDFTRVRSIEEGVDLLGSSGKMVLGCIFNCVEKNSGRYGYGYGYGRYGYGRYGYGQNKNRN